MRPLIGIPGRFAAHADGLRRDAVVNAERLLAGVYNAGGEPLTIFPSDDGLDDRLNFLNGILLPGGGDVDPHLYGETTIDDSVYGVNAHQDAFDVAVLTWALERGLPTLAICRGFQVVNVALGGTLEQNMSDPHRNRRHTVSVSGAVAELTGSTVDASCYHHQRVKDLAPGLRVLATADDGTIEAADLPSATGWFLAVQWHPEDTAADDSAQQSIFNALVNAAKGL